MADTSRVSQLTCSNSIRLAYKIISYLAAWLVALFVTNPTVAFGRWPGCFPSVLLLSLIRTEATVAVGECLGLAWEFILFTPIFTSAPGRRSFCSPSLPFCSSAMSRGAERCSRLT